jgi:tellurite methyltransferase
MLGGLLVETDWDKRYRDRSHGGLGAPHELLRRFWPAIPKGQVIDVAMGGGRNALFLAGKGFGVCGVEKSAEAIKIARRLLDDRVAIIRGDAERLPFRQESAEGVLVFYFLLRSIMGDIVTILKKGGVVIYETFLKRQNEIDKPRNPEYLLDDGELISFFRGFDLIFYEETLSIAGRRKRAVAKLVGRKR